MSINRVMDKEVVHIYNRILLSHEKEWNNAIYNNMDRPKHCCTDRSQSDRREIYGIMHQTWMGDSFHTWYYTCFNAILPNHPTLSFSHQNSPKDYSLHLCLFCCLAYRVMVTIFLNSMYVCVSILYWCSSFWFTSLCIIRSSFIHLIRMDSNAFF